MDDNSMPVVGRIVRDATTDCLIKKGKWWNIEVIDIRWFKNDKPTNKGIRLNMQEAEQLIKILRRRFVFFVY